MRPILPILACLPVITAFAADDLQIIPCPVQVERGDGEFHLSGQTVIVFPATSPESEPTGSFLKDVLRAQNGLRLRVKAVGLAESSINSISLELNATAAGLGAEGYELMISPERVLVRADESAGLFYGVQTLLQLASPELAGRPSPTKASEIRLPVLRIVDRPRFAWRGLLLDCSRTFLSLEYLKKCVDVCSFYKVNVLHLHLTDDQGWRLEIRKHPRLTEIGSKFDSRFAGEVNGYYTQRQIRELVRYAAERHVTIVPEIEMPAHCLALLKSYPELSCRGGKDDYVIAPYLFMSDPDPHKQPKTPHGVLCPGNDKTFEIVEDILAEVMNLFPSEYIHIAGDECSKASWKACPKCQARVKAEGLKDEEELQSYFVRRVAGMVQTRGRKAMGWDEVLEGGLPSEVAVMSWRSFEAGITAAKLGRPVVMASKSHVYFDYSYNRAPAALVYNYEPVPPELNSPELRSRVLGGEACMWTHLARSETSIDMSVFPRVLALAETLWTPVERKDWDDFSVRLERHERVLESKGVACFDANEGPGLPNLTCGQDGRLWLVNAAGEIFLWKGHEWKRFPGQARQVTSTFDGAIWSVSTKPAKRGFALAKWSAPENEWQPVGRGVTAVQISAAPDNSLWATANDYAIYRWADGKWSNVIGLAREASVGPDGTTWVLTMDPSAGGYELHAAPPSGRFRRVVPMGGGEHIAAAGNGQVWLRLDNGDLKFFDGRKYFPRPGQPISLTANNKGEAWALFRSSTTSVANLAQWIGRGWKDAGPVP